MSQHNDYINYYKLYCTVYSTLQFQSCGFHLYLTSNFHVVMLRSFNIYCTRRTVQICSCWYSAISTLAVADYLVRTGGQSKCSGQVALDLFCLLMVMWNRYSQPQPHSHNQIKHTCRLVLQFRNILYVKQD